MAGEGPSCTPITAGRSCSLVSVKMGCRIRFITRTSSVGSRKKAHRRRRVAMCFRPAVASPAGHAARSPEYSHQLLSLAREELTLAPLLHLSFLLNRRKNCADSPGAIGILVVFRACKH